jgi:hypothetical protein
MSVIDKAYKLLIIILFSVPVSLHAQADADSLFEASEWEAAADAYASRTASDPRDAIAWFRLAVSSRHAERYAVARNALAKAEELKFSAVRISLERARLSVLAEDADGAVNELLSVASSGFTAVNVITADPVLATLAGDAAYDQLVAEMSRRAFPCEHDAAFSAFDFWLGEWDVHTADGTYAGSNAIARAERGCVLTENWSSAGGGSGMSVNYLDRISNKWVQIWNDASGSQINISGGMTEDGMLLVGTIHYVANGTTAPFRGLWTPLPDGRVRQFFEQMSPDGETWSPWFEGFYSRKPLE